MPKSRKISIEEVEEHATPDDLWMVIDSKVYDMSNYAHPGGKIFLSGAASDATVMFHHYHLGKTKKNAVAVLNKHQIGVISDKKSPVMGKFYDELAVAVGERLKDLPRYPLQPQIIFFIDAVSLIFLAGFCAYVGYTGMELSTLGLFMTSYLTGLFSNRMSAHAHVVGHMSLFPKEFVAYAEMITLCFGSRHMPVYALPSETAVYRRKLNKDHVTATNEYASQRGPFQHQAIHHVRGAALEHDVCKRGSALGGFIRISGVDPLKPVHRLQSSLIGRNFIYCFVSIIVDNYFWILKVQYFSMMVRFKQFSHAIGSVIGVLFEFCVVYGSWFLPARDYRVLAALILLRHWLNFLVFFYAQHEWGEEISDEEGDSDWGYHNARASISFRGKYMWMHPLFIGCNGCNPGTLLYHLEHTMFPGVSYFYLPYIAPVIEEVAKKHKVPYNKIDSYVDLCKKWGSDLKKYGYGGPHDPNVQKKKA